LRVSWSPLSARFIVVSFARQRLPLKSFSTVDFTAAAILMGGGQRSFWKKLTTAMAGCQP